MDADNEAKGGIDRFYQILTVLDTKATGLLTIDALVAAILLGVLALSPTNTVKIYVPDCAIWYALAAIILSAFLCMLIVRISWAFLGKVNEKDFKTEIECLARVAHDRTWFYRCAWWLVLFGIFAVPVTACFQWIHAHG